MEASHDNRMSILRIRRRILRLGQLLLPDVRKAFFKSTENQNGYKEIHDFLIPDLIFLLRITRTRPFRGDFRGGCVCLVLQFCVWGGERHSPFQKLAVGADDFQVAPMNTPVPAEFNRFPVVDCSVKVDFRYFFAAQKRMVADFRDGAGNFHDA